MHRSLKWSLRALDIGFRASLHGGIAKVGLLHPVEAHLNLMTEETAKSPVEARGTRPRSLPAKRWPRCRRSLKAVGEAINFPNVAHCPGFEKSSVQAGLQSREREKARESTRQGGLCTETPWNLEASLGCLQVLDLGQQLRTVPVAKCCHSGLSAKRDAVSLLRPLSNNAINKDYAPQTISKGKRKQKWKDDVMDRDHSITRAMTKTKSHKHKTRVREHQTQSDTHTPC